MVSRGLLLIVGGAVIAGVPSLVANPFDWKAAALTWFGLVVSVVGGIVQERDGQPYVQDFETDDWSAASDGFFIEIPRDVHRKGRAGTAEIYVRDARGRHQPCVDSVGRDDEGNCRIDQVLQPFSCRIVIQ